MIGASKILTVSYGTFSCTLEGFDDPFNTMRAIAEYFRDLAAEDRYFGAEPPTPDAAMLHKIAEREIQRRVEAKIQDNGVILRARDAVADPAVERALPQFAEPTPQPALAAAEPAAVESVVAKLSRLRDAQIETAPAMAAVIDDSFIEDEYADLSPAAPQALEEIEAEGEGASQPAVFEEDSVEDSSTAEDSIASIMAGLEDTPALPDAAVEFTTDAETTASDVTFAMIDALPEDIPAADEWPSEDTADYTDIDLGDAPITEAAASVLPDSILPDTVLPDSAVSDSAVSNSDLPAADLPLARTDEDIMAAALGAMIDPEGDNGFEDEAFDDALLPDFSDDEPMAVAEEIPEAVAETIEGVPEVIADELPEVVTEALSDSPAPDSAVVAILPEAAPEPTVTEPNLTERLQRARARVIKIRRIDPGASAPQVEPAAPQPAPVAEAPSSLAPASVLSPEAEAELQRELAALEAEGSPMQSAPDVAIEPAPETAPEVETLDAHKLPEPPQSDDAVNRLISQTNSVMEGPENKRRLAAIAHLKAAVAATFADRKSNPGASQPGTEGRMDPYRDDLDRVVRPRRPALVGGSSTEPTGAVTPRPQIESRPAPLVLVSEQRIDRPAASAEPISPVRPRRVTTSILSSDPMQAVLGGDDFDEESALSADDMNNIFSDPSQPFAEFADRLGATSMPEMLEAAAAYCALHLGREQFTRPLLLQQIADLPEGEAISREDCLRGFGTLLRDGRIEKIKRGQFKLADHSRYLAEAKRQAG